MSVLETVLVFVGIPLGIVFVITVAVYGRSMTHQPNRYRPGRAWNYPPSWYVPHPDAVVPSGSATPLQLESGMTTTAVGGASGEW